MKHQKVSSDFLWRKQGVQAHNFLATTNNQHTLWVHCCIKHYVHMLMKIWWHLYSFWARSMSTIVLRKMLKVYKSQWQKCAPNEVEHGKTFRATSLVCIGKCIFWQKLHAFLAVYRVLLPELLLLVFLFGEILTFSNVTFLTSKVVHTFAVKRHRKLAPVTPIWKWI